MPPPPRRSDDPNLSGMILDAEVLDAQVLDAEVLDADILDAEVLDAVPDASVIEAEVIDAEPLPLDEPASQPSAVFDISGLESSPASAGTAPAAAFPVFRSVPTDQAPTGADLLSLDADPPRPARRTASHPATATRPAVRITFVASGEASPFAPRG